MSVRLPAQRLGRERHLRRARSAVSGRLRPGLLVLACCSGLVAMPALADTNDAATSTSADVAVDVSLWVRDAPLSMLVGQLAQQSGRELAIEGALDMPVSGRFHGSMEQTLADLSSSYPVLFDLDESTLRATGIDSASNVSIAVLSEELTEDFKAQLFDQVSPGNDIEIRADAVRVSGHPVFVKRATGMITSALADSGARHIVEQNAETDLTEVVADMEAAPDAAGELAGEAVIDSGSDEMLADIADEAKPPADQAQLSRPIRWVTDIPGFHTF